MEQGKNATGQEKNIPGNELKKLKRVDLLEMLVELSKENEALQGRLDEALDKLAKRDITINKAGSIAEAALHLNGVFAAAQNAGAQYLENIQRLSSEQEAICAQLIEDSKERSSKLISDTIQKCQEMEDDSRKKCDAMIANAENESKKYWDTVSEKLEKFYETHGGLRELLSFDIRKEKQG